MDHTIHNDTDHVNHMINIIHIYDLHDLHDLLYTIQMSTMIYLHDI